MGLPHGHALHYHGHSPIHVLPAHLKLVALVGFVIVVVSTPQQIYLPYLGYLVLLSAAVALAKLPLRFVLPRLAIELPVIFFMVFLVFWASGPRMELAGVSVSTAGLSAGATILGKSTCAVLAGIVLVGTTEPAQLIQGMYRLRLPAILIEIMSFMLRYVAVIIDEYRRMSIARQARGFQPRSVRQWRIIAASLGTLFIRSFERGERIHHAMLARGYAGRLPVTPGSAVSRKDYAVAMVFPVLAVAALGVSSRWG